MIENRNIQSQYRAGEPGIRWHLSVSPTLVLVRSANDASGLAIHSVNAARRLNIRSDNAAAQLPDGQSERNESASYAQTECKEASVLTRSDNAAAQLADAQAKREATAAQSGRTKGTTQLPYGVR